VCGSFMGCEKSFIPMKLHWHIYLAFILGKVTVSMKLALRPVIIDGIRSLSPKDYYCSHWVNLDHVGGDWLPQLGRPKSHPGGGRALCL
jgi:hypothetical protein